MFKTFPLKTNSPIFLFDLDGTLLTTGGSGRKAFQEAFRELFPQTSPIFPDDLSGLTDRLIYRQALSSIGRRFRYWQFLRFQYLYVNKLIPLVYQKKPVVMPGIKESLMWLAEQKIRFGLYTGNVPVGAMVKISPTEISRFFLDKRLDQPLSFMAFYFYHRKFQWNRYYAFGHRGKTRLDLIKQISRWNYRKHSWVVIGDTERDIEVAKAIRAVSVFVRTGKAKSIKKPHLQPDYQTDHLSSFLLKEICERLKK